MGDRALVVFHDGEDVSPTVYLHWGGKSVPSLIDKLKTLMGSRTGDVPYSCARFIGIAHMEDPKSNLSLGVWNTPPDIESVILNPSLVVPQVMIDYSHGDAGVVVCDCRTFAWVAYCGYLSRDNEPIEADT